MPDGLALSTNMTGCTTCSRGIQECPEACLGLCGLRNRNEAAQVLEPFPTQLLCRAWDNQCIKVDTSCSTLIVHRLQCIGLMRGIVSGMHKQSEFNKIDRLGVHSMHFLD